MTVDGKQTKTRPVYTERSEVAGFCDGKWKPCLKSGILYIEC